MDKAKPVGIWIRVSTEDQAKGESPEHHEKRICFYVEPTANYAFFRLCASLFTWPGAWDPLETLKIPTFWLMPRKTRP
jgi:hypothetical protein